MSAVHMHFPVRCAHCGKVYDMGAVTVTARYADCSMWQSPCCDRLVDSRRWKSLPDYTELTAEEARTGVRFVDMWGRYR